jgi:hypothetical protein
MVITQEDCISAHRAEKKRRITPGPSGAQQSRFRLVPQSVTRPPPRANLPGRWWLGPHSSPSLTDSRLLLNSSNSSKASGPLPLLLVKETTATVVSIVAAPRTSSKTVRNLGDRPKGSPPTQTIRAKGRNKWYKFAKVG